MCASLKYSYRCIHAHSTKASPSLLPSISAQAKRYAILLQNLSRIWSKWSLCLHIFCRCLLYLFLRLASSVDFHIRKKASFCNNINIFASQAFRCMTEREREVIKGYVRRNSSQLNLSQGYYAFFFCDFNSRKESTARIVVDNSQVSWTTDISYTAHVKYITSHDGYW